MIIFKSHQTIDIITPYLPENPVIVEAGAYNGLDTIKIAHHWPQGTVHAFEPVPDIFTRLQQTTASYKNINIYNVALSDVDGTALLYLAEKKEKPGVVTQASSLHAPKERLQVSPIIFPRTLSVPTITLDTWSQRYNITHVDMLWLDVQGHELAVLKAAPTLLKTVSAVLLEVAFIQAYAEQPSVDEVMTWMSTAGFTCVARDFVDENQWFFGNLLFVRQSSSISSTGSSESSS